MAKRHRQTKDTFAVPNMNGLPPDKRPRKPPPSPAKRNATTPLVLPVELQRTWFTSAAKMLRQPSIAYRLDPTMQMMMRKDADIEAPIRALQMNIAALRWGVEAVDPDDAAAAENASIVEKRIRDIPRLADLFRWLLEAIWYGPSAVNLIYGKDDDGIYVREWEPIHPDTLAADQYGNYALRVGAAYYMDTRDAVTDIGFDSRVHILTEQERKALVIHTVFRSAPNFIDPNETGLQYLGVGARDVCWFLWMAKQEVLQAAITYAERYAMGVRIGYYPAGNDQAREEILSALANLVGDNSICLPRTEPGAKDYEIEVQEPTGNGSGTYLPLIQWISGRLKETVLGQSLSSEAAGTGMGSGVADLHADTMSKLIRFHADGLGQSITTDLLAVINESMYGDDAPRLRFIFAPPKPKPDEYLNAVDKFVSLGGRVSEREVRESLGLSEPSEDEPMLHSSQGGGATTQEQDPMDLPKIDTPGIDDEEESETKHPEQVKVQSSRRRA